ncbi:LPS export ABC transporter permease LptF [Bathymodiolus thermophilus thioautotrophic gill symbiont]|uniref:Lipopolysaccharide export system permease protein LptF n=1 Tax=Bathymodiolus thermophilus thioautotrophic gill symbiont TaxID=2360 RepID=A0A1J5TWK5_9GAMM|nr:LPS export ABC transporter permease LptF [Bathymodiolus thermophilus thioautotrophic gill symbiont]OIR25138.1 LPS export ABC transporter permease LptF [Bathymodiolus thermophilus thioautotrophic gill symbiont]
MRRFSKIPGFKHACYLIDTIIAKYLMRNVWVVSGAIFLIISLVILGNQVVLMIQKSLEYGIPTADLLPLIVFNMIGDMSLILSLSLFLAIILAISKLYQSSEAIVMNSLGVGDKHFMVFIQPVVLPIFIFVLLLTTLVVPWTKQQKNLVMSRSEHTPEFAFIKQKEFQEFQGGDIIFYATKVTDGVKDTRKIMEEVFIYALVGGEPVITLAKKAQKYTDPSTNNIYLRLKDGVRYHGFLGNDSKRILNFDGYDLQIMDGKKQQSEMSNTQIESRSTIDLFYADGAKEVAEFQWRLSQPLSIFILSFLGVLLGKASPRGGKNLGVLFGVAIFILYNNALMIAKSALEHGGNSIWGGLWWVHLLMFGFILILYGYRYEKFRTLTRFFVRRVK